MDRRSTDMGRGSVHGNGRFVAPSASLPVLVAERAAIDRLAVSFGARLAGFAWVPGGGWLCPTRCRLVGRVAGVRAGAPKDGAPAGDFLKTLRVLRAFVVEKCGAQPNRQRLLIDRDFSPRRHEEHEDARECSRPRPDRTQVPIGTVPCPKPKRGAGLARAGRAPPPFPIVFPATASRPLVRRREPPRARA